MSSKTLHFLALNLLTLIAATTTVMASEPLDVPARNAVGPGFKLRFKKEARIRVGMHESAGTVATGADLYNESYLRFETEKGRCTIFAHVDTSFPPAFSDHKRVGKLARVAVGRELLVIHNPESLTRGGLDRVDTAASDSEGQPLREVVLHFGSAPSGWAKGTYRYYDGSFNRMVCTLRRGAALGLNSQLWVTLREIQEILGDSLEVLPEALELPTARHESKDPAMVGRAVASSLIESGSSVGSTD